MNYEVFCKLENPCLKSLSGKTLVECLDIFYYIMKSCKNLRRVQYTCARLIQIVKDVNAHCKVNTRFFKEVIATAEFQ